VHNDSNQFIKGHDGFMLFTTIRNGSKRSNTGFNTAQHSSIQCNTAQHCSTRSNAAQHGSGRFNAVQHGSTRINTVQHGSTRLNTVHACWAVHDGSKRFNTGSTQVHNGSRRFETVQHGSAKLSTCVVHGTLDSMVKLLPDGVEPGGSKARVVPHVSQSCARPGTFSGLC